MTAYRLFGLTIESAIPLSGAPVATGKVDAQIRVHDAPDGVRYDEFSTRSDGEGRIVIEHDGIRYEVTDGEQIDVRVPRDADPLRVRGWLTGVTMGALLVQRGRLPLHATAVAQPSGNGVAAFVGDSGAGKSTLAFQLARAGHDLWCDDLLAVRFEDEVLADRGFARIKLWQESADHFALPTDDLPRVVADADKYELPLEERHGGNTSLPLRRIYLLERGDAQSAPMIEPVGGADAVGLLVENIYRWRVTRLWHGSDRWAFERCLDVVRSAELFRFTRPWSLDRAEESFALLQAHLQT